MRAFPSKIINSHDYVVPTSSGLRRRRVFLGNRTRSRGAAAALADPLADDDEGDDGDRFYVVEKIEFI